MVTLTQEEKEENGFCDEKEEKKGKEKKRKEKKRKGKMKMSGPPFSTYKGGITKL